MINTDALDYGGSGVGNFGAVAAEQIEWHGRPFSASLSVPPLGAVWLRPGEGTGEMTRWLPNSPSPTGHVAPNGLLAPNPIRRTSRWSDPSGPARGRFRQ